MLDHGMILGGRYEVQEHIGTGGMANVYRAWDRESRRYVALKVLKNEYYDDEVFIRRFIKEAEATINIDHPNIVEIYDADFKDGYHYIVMELVPGMTLKKYIRRYGRLSARETVDIARQIGQGLKAAHAHHIVHRDIKPQNIIICEDGRVKVTDFGIARIASGDTLSANTMGSVQYFSPEQARGGFSDERSDIYSLGITIYEMATGKVPFDGENNVAVALMHLKEEITPPRCYFPDIPESLEKIILKCTMKSPNQRYQNADALLRDLDLVFEIPDGSFVHSDSLVDDSPTVKRDEDEIAEIKKGLRQPEDTDEGTDGNGEEGGSDLLDSSNGNGGRNHVDDPDEEEEDEEESKVGMQRLILVLAIMAGLFFAGIIAYLIGSSFDIIHRGQESTTETPTEITTEATTATEEPGVTMIDLTGMTREEVEEALEELDLIANFVYVDGADSGTEGLMVVAQDHAKGEKVPPKTTITVTLGPDPSLTVEQVEVPALLNMKEEKARETLEGLGLEVKLAYTNSDTVKEGYVADQSPKGGSVVNKGFKVTITISKGVSQARVPTLSGLSQEAAEKELNRVGLVLGKVSSGYSGEVGVGEVISQDIESGTMVDRGTAVSIVISLGEQQSYRYEGEVRIEESPFQEDETGTVKLVMKQNGKKTVVFDEDGMTSEDFPLEVTFDAEEEGKATVTMYINGEEYNTYPVTVNAMAD